MTYNVTTQYMCIVHVLYTFPCHSLSYICVAQTHTIQLIPLILHLPCDISWMPRIMNMMSYADRMTTKISLRNDKPRITIMSTTHNFRKCTDTKFDKFGDPTSAILVQNSPSRCNTTEDLCHAQRHLDMQLTHHESQHIQVGNIPNETSSAIQHPPYLRNLKMRLTHPDLKQPRIRCQGSRILQKKGLDTVSQTNT